MTRLLLRRLLLVLLLATAGCVGSYPSLRMRGGAFQPRLVEWDSDL
jgi:hypothetical protein